MRLHLLAGQPAETISVELQKGAPGFNGRDGRDGLPGINGVHGSVTFQIVLPQISSDI